MKELAIKLEAGKLARLGSSAPGCSVARQKVIGTRASEQLNADDALRVHGLTRQVVVTVPGFPDAIRIARHSDLVALVPHSCFGIDQGMTDGLCAFDLPVETPGIDVAAMWHPRFDRDPAHRWFRETVLSTFRATRLA